MTRRPTVPHRGPLIAICNNLNAAAGQRFSRSSTVTEALPIKVIAALSTHSPLPGRGPAVSARAILTILKAVGRLAAVLTHEHPSRTVMSVAMNICGIPVARRRRSATGSPCDKPASRMAIVGRWHAGSVGQSARRTRCSARPMAQRSPSGFSVRRISHRRQVAQLAGRLPPNGAIRLERLRGFGAPLGMLVTCGCARLDFPDGSQGILVRPPSPPAARCR